MTNIRHAAVSGMFYPADATELTQFVQEALQAAKPPSSCKRPKAIIVPHAGYIYSGPIAATAYKLIEKYHQEINKVVLLGPSHRTPLLGLAACNAEYFESPLGTIEIDESSILKLIKLPQVKMFNEAHALEHSLEVQLPFLQLTLGDFSLIPLVVGDASPQEVAEVLDQVWGGKETLIVISSDLSHYLDYQTAQRLDKTTSEAIEQLNPEAIRYDNACGRNAVNGLLTIAKQKAMHATTIDLRNSGDTAGNKDQVVGYGAYTFE